MEHRFRGKDTIVLYNKGQMIQMATARWRKYTISCQEYFVATRTTPSLLVHYQLETHTNLDS